MRPVAFALLLALVAAPGIFFPPEGRCVLAWEAADAVQRPDPEIYGLVRLWSSNFGPNLGRRAWLSAVAGVKTPWSQNDLRENERLRQLPLVGDVYGRDGVQSEKTNVNAGLTLLF
jgi:hypothetical protein